MRFDTAETSETPSWALSRAVVVLLGLAAGVVAAAAIKQSSSVVGPTLLALMLTVAVHPLRRWLRGKGWPPCLCVVAALTVVYGILLGLMTALVISIARFATFLPAYKDKFDDLVTQGRQLLEDRGVGTDELRGAFNVDATADLTVTWTMLALVFWGWVLGPLGALLAIPLTLLSKALLIDIDPATRWVDAMINSKVVDPSQEGQEDRQPEGVG
jgi:predicted PurR-regulated permease PerM